MASNLNWTWASAKMPLRSLPHSFLGGYGSIVDTVAENDSVTAKTWSRIMVEHFFQKFEWYFPKHKHKNKSNPPSLAKAWAYYEHVTLPRCYAGEHRADTVLHRAKQGEREEKTELYDPFFTPQSALIEWGTGIDLYFVSLKVFATLLLIAGLINIVSMSYYDSVSYNGEDAQDEVDFLLKGSALCTNTAWVVCENCKPDQWSLDKSRFATSADGTTLVLRNLCRGAASVNGMASFCTLVVLLVSFSLLFIYLRRREIRLDEDRMTGSDYSVVVENPPANALNPDEWRVFFEQFSPDNDQVTVVSIALNNEALIRKLIKRRKLRRKLNLILPENAILDDESDILREIEYLKLEEAEGKECLFSASIFGFSSSKSAEKLVNKIAVLTEEIKELQKKEYKASKVFVTFETEVSQRAALEALTVGGFHLHRNYNLSMKSEHFFRSTRVLKVRQPCEPNDVRWLDLSAGKLKRLQGRLLTFTMTLVILAAVGVGIKKTRDSMGPSVSGILTSISNAIIPHIIKFLMVFEIHKSESTYQTSLYTKVTIFRWTLSAILAQIITPFTSILSTEKTDLLPTISHILLADVYIVPLLKLLDIGGNVKKHFLGPRARTQEEMNMYFQGSHYNLGERYTDMTKTLFLVFYYSALFPAGFFFGAVILTIQFHVDKFSLMRLWGWSPLMGSQLANFSRNYFFTGAFIAFALVSSYTWAQFPYDNVCENSEIGNFVNGTYFEVSTLEGSLLNGDGLVDVIHETSVVYCDQSWRANIGISLSRLPHIDYENGSWSFWFEKEDFPWMTSPQVWLTTVYGWVAMAVVLAFTVTVVFKLAHTVFLIFFMNKYEPEGDCQHIDFSSDPDVFAYVPQVKVKGFPFPFLICDIDMIDPGLIGSEDKDRSRDYYNLIFDVPYPGLRRKKIRDDPETPAESFNNSVLQRSNDEKAGGRPIYSLIKHYPTNWQIELAKKSESGVKSKSKQDQTLRKLAPSHQNPHKA